MGEDGIGRFPYHLLKHEVHTEERQELQQLASLVKSKLGLRIRLSHTTKVVIAVRTHTRIFVNAEELKARLLSEGIEATTARFGDHGFRLPSTLHALSALCTTPFS